MPKLSIDFPAQLSVQVTWDMKYKLVAIGYMTGNGGEYATPARNLLDKAVREVIEKMTPAQRKEFDQILENVRIREETRRAINEKTPV